MENRNILDDQENLIRRLVCILERGARPVQVFETHISWILIAGDYAYKFKKAVHFDFVDFSTLDARYFYCLEELRLNRRLAPNIYLAVVAITGDPVYPVVGGSGTPIEYAVKMRAFPQQALWSHRIENGSLSTQDIDDLARLLAKFHQGAAIAPRESLWGSRIELDKIANENLIQISVLVKDAAGRCNTSDLGAWQSAQQCKLGSVLEERKEQGFVRECHGDLHSENILTFNNQVVVFDCIEFNESLRWIDVMNDFAFIYMELRFHGLNKFAARMLNSYLEITGDYDGMAVLRYYQTQRALVRCKVSLLRERQLEADIQTAAYHQIRAAKYLAFALQTSKPTRSVIIITHGYSGCGKSTFSRILVELVDAVQIRSDVERKRMQGIIAPFKIAAPFGTGLYDRSVTRATYERLCTLARNVSKSGTPVIVDAAFLEREQRRQFQDLASELGVPFFIADICASEATLRKRIVTRTQVGSDPSDAGLEVLAHQLLQHDVLSDDEKKHVILIDSEAGLDPDMVRKGCQPIVASIRGATVDCPHN